MIQETLSRHPRVSCAEICAKGTRKGDEGQGKETGAILVLGNTTSLHIIQIVTGIEVNSEAYLLFPDVAGILPKCRRHAGNIPANEGNQPHYSPMMQVTIFLLHGWFCLVFLSGLSLTS